MPQEQIILGLRAALTQNFVVSNMLALPRDAVHLLSVRTVRDSYTAQAYAALNFSFAGLVVSFMASAAGTSSSKASGSNGSYNFTSVHVLCLVRCTHIR